jgi:cyclic 2,3-diphosphoglycerate synthetase
MRAIALIDGEHHPVVARDALDRVAAEHDLAGVVFVGGEEKIASQVLADPAAHYGRDVVIAADDPAAGLRTAADAGAEAVLDLSGEPVLGGDERMRLASVALSLGLEYRCAGFHVAPPPREQLDAGCPVIAVIGTGKRTGKTALAGHFATVLKDRGIEPVIVSMGRGGPPQPLPLFVGGVVPPDAARLLEIGRGGGHAASDYLEDAVVAGVACVGCRRCGEGPAGEVFDSNVIEGAKLAISLGPDVLLLEGSGAALPPVAAGRTVCVTTALRAEREALSHLGPYRLLSSDLLVVFGADALSAGELAALTGRLGEWIEPSKIVACTLVPEPLGLIPPGARVAFFSTSAAHEGPLRESLEKAGADLCVTSANLARRSLLERDMELAARERCNVFLTELKAAAIEVVAEEAERRGALVEFVRNRPVALPGQPALDERLALLYEEALAPA